jgi:hypothetical protein
MTSATRFAEHILLSVAGSQAVTGSGAVALFVALIFAPLVEADITPTSSSLSATSLADVDPLDKDPVSDTDGTTDGVLTDLSVTTVSMDAVPPNLSEVVTTSASVTYSGNNMITVAMHGSRTGTDSNLGAPGGAYQSIAAYRLPFENLAAGTTLTVAWDLDWVRPSEGTTSPHGIALGRGFDLDSRGLTIPFNALEGPASGMETFQLTATGSGFFDLYTLEIELYMVGASTDLAPAESWDATFVITTPPITTIPEPGLLGDFNDDGKVDAADYVVWRKNDAGATALPNDDDLGTPIRAEHYNLWRAHFGEMPMPGIGAGSTIPEAGTIVLAAVSLLLFGSCRRANVRIQCLNRASFT